MSNDAGRYAQLPVGSNVVENTILMDASFVLDGYTFIKVGSGVTCEPGSYYNKDDGLFYADSEFTSLSSAAADNDLEASSE